MIVSWNTNHSALVKVPSSMYSIPSIVAFASEKWAFLMMYRVSCCSACDSILRRSEALICLQIQAVCSFRHIRPDALIQMPERSFSLLSEVLSCCWSFALTALLPIGSALGNTIFIAVITCHSRFVWLATVFCRQFRYWIKEERGWIV